MSKRFYYLLILPILFWVMAFSASADVVGEHHTFFVNPAYDSTGRMSVSATLIYVSTHAYIYAEDSYLNNLNSFERRTFDANVAAAAQGFDSTIYPKETQFFGSEPNPGIDNDSHITILLERLTSGTGGYFDSVNEYTPQQVTHTNQREMIVTSILSIDNNHALSFLSHEFQHLISFNQKELLRNTSEDTWLNELRSQYGITVVGYNDSFVNSDLYQRALNFIQNSTDSLTEWPNTLIDYSSVTLFGEYLTGRFGTSILQDTLKSASIGIPSVNGYISTHQPGGSFNSVFADWVWASYVNNRFVNPNFGYANQNLQSLHIPPTDSRVLTASTKNTFAYSLKSWQPTLYQFVTDPSAPQDKNIKITWGNSNFEIYYADANGPRLLHDGDVVSRDSIGQNFILIPINISKITSFSSTEVSIPLNLSIEYTDQPVQLLKDGALIRHADTPDIYVVTGPYKRLLPLSVLKFYGLDPASIITVSEATFQSYMTSNYIRSINEKKVYAVWPDGTKHWLNMTAQHFTDSHRDWNLIFTVNDLESNFYHIGPDITQ